MTTTNGIEYESFHLDGSEGSRFILYPETGKHKDDDVKLADKELRNCNIVISLQVRWKKIDDKQPNPEKIPDYLIIRGLQVRIGELESRIEEEQDALKRALTDEKKQLRKEIQNEEVYTQIKKENSKLKSEYKNLREQISGLIAQQQHPK